MIRREFASLFAKSSFRDNSTTSKLRDGSRVAVMGGGPAGSFFSYFLLEMASRVDMGLQVDIYEPRDFSKPAPQGCNMCAGVISETLVQELAAEGINLPTPVLQRAVDSYILHTNVGNLRIATPFDEKRIGVVFRAIGPRGITNSQSLGLDGYLLSLAAHKGAHVIQSRVVEVNRMDNCLQVKARDAPPQIYDLLAVTVGVNSTALKFFENQEFNYKSPKTTKTAIREYYLGAEKIEKFIGSSLHVFLLDIPELDFAMIVPKVNYVTVCLIGSGINDDLFQTFLMSPEVRSCFPNDWNVNQPHCKCFPYLNIYGAEHPYSDRVVFIGDSGTTKLYKDGIGSAYRAAKAAAFTVIFEGLSDHDFKKFYNPICRAIQFDNQIGRVIFFITHLIQRNRFFRQAILHMAAREQLENIPPRLSSVLWDTFTGSAPYKDIFLRTLRPGFIKRLVKELALSYFKNADVENDRFLVDSPLRID